MQLNLTAKLFDIQGRQIKTFIIEPQESFVKINENQTWVDKFIVHP